ncbi:MAG TPA: protein kinase [Polyangiaceae bacterium]|jgi:serine/threonine-protein kinase
MPADSRRAEPSDLSPGTVINGKYRVVSLMASGGMGRIYRAEQAPLGRIVALKVLRTPHGEDDEVEVQFRKRFFREASILAKLQHVNVVTLFDYGRIEGDRDERYFIAMEHLAGETLSDRLRADGALAVQDALRILRQLARGLREAHRLGAVHRDLKPSNVMLVPEEDGGEVVKILDFGIGKLVDGPEEQELTQEGTFLGSPKYIAPEQVNERRVDARTDVYSLGVIAYECLCGVVPYERETNLETILAHCNAPLPAMAARSPGTHVPEVVEGLVRRCLEKEPEARPQGMEEVLRGIGECERALFGTASLGAVQREAPRGGGMESGTGPTTTEADTLALTPVAQRRPSMGTASPLTASGPPPAARQGARTPLLLALTVALLVGGFVAVQLVARGRGRAVTATAPEPPASVSAIGPAASLPVASGPAPSGDTPAPPPSSPSDSASASASAAASAPAPVAPALLARPPRARSSAPAATASSHPPPDLDIKLQR